MSSSVGAGKCGRTDGCILPPHLERDPCVVPIRALVEASSLGTDEAVAARASVTDEQVERVMARVRELRAAEFATKHPGCCPRCGWHMSSHGDSGYGPDCPWGASPAANAGDLPVPSASPTSGEDR